MIPGLPLLENLLLIGGLLLIVALIFAPFETLGWWAGWLGSPNSPTPDENQGQSATEGKTNPDATHYVVYLEGIDDISGDHLSDLEARLLDKLKARLPKVVIVSDVFPYSPTNTALTGQRMFAWLWRWLSQRRLKHGKPIEGFLINLRNLTQVAVVSDNRYGPLYSYGSAKMIREGLKRHGYPIGSGIPVTLIGFSGGGSISLGASTYLSQMLDAPVQVISLAGVLCSDPGLLHIEHLYHLYGSRDSVQRLGRLIFPSRWPIMPHSAWNRAKATGKISLICLGPMGHVDPGGYFDPDITLENGLSHADNTLNHLIEIIEHGAATKKYLSEQPGQS